VGCACCTELTHFRLLQCGETRLHVLARGKGLRDDGSVSGGLLQDAAVHDALAHLLSEPAILQLLHKRNGVGFTCARLLLFSY